MEVESSILDIFDTILTISDTAGRIVDGVAAVLFAIMAIAGLLYCFFGFKLMRLGFAICGFILGAVAGFLVTSLALHVESIGPHIFAALAGGVLGAFLLYRIYLLGVFLMNTALGFLIFILLLGTGNASLIISGVCAIIFGILAVKFVRIWTILTTGISGGLLAGSSIASLLGANQVLSLLFGVIIAVLGILYQWKSTGKAKKKDSAAAVAAPESTMAYSAAGAAVQSENPSAENTQVPGGAPAVAAVQVNPPAVKTTGKLKALWADKQKRLFLCAGAGAVVLVVVLVALFGGSKTPRPATVEPLEIHAKMGYKAADGKDISKSALWLDSYSIDFYNTYLTPVSYHVGSETAAVIVRWDEYELGYGLVNQNGSVTAYGYEKLGFGGYVDNEPWFCCLSNDYSFLGFINARGERVLDLTEHNISTYYCDAMRFNGDICIVMEEKYGGGALYGIIDIYGNFIVPYSLDYDWVFPPMFYEGYAMAQISDGTLGGDTYGLIDSRGQEVIPCIYDIISSVQNGKLIAMKDNKYGALNTDGSIAEPFTYSTYNEVALKLGWLDERDIPLKKLKETYQSVESLGKGLFAVRIYDEENDYYPVGIVDYNGKVIVKPAYLNISACSFEPGLFQVWDGDTTFYCDWTGERRTPDFDGSAIYGITPIFRQNGNWGVLPKLLTDKEQKEFSKR